VKLVRSVEEKDWTDFVRATPQGSVYQTPEMAKVYENTTGYEPVSVFAVEGGRIRGLALANVLWNGRWPLRTFSRRCLLHGGPLYSDPQSAQILLRGLDEIVSNKAIYTEIRNLLESTEAVPLPKSSGYSYAAHLNYHLDLRKGEDGIWSGMSKGRRKGITKAEKADLEVTEITREAEIDDFYDLLEKTYSSIRVPLAHKSLFVSAFRILNPLQEARFLICKSEGTAIACRGVLIYGRTIYDWYAGSIGGERTRNADEYLVWNLLKWGISHEFETFDFGGAGSPDEEYGPREFKRRFGGSMLEPGRFEKIYKPTLYSFSKRMFRFYRRLL
jgi:lipid II:glycine glycyltransferase (peptidoglycan interpeptide bridge formation enzyme)